MSCVVAKYGDPVRMVCADVCPQFADLAVSETSESSVCCSHINTFSREIVAMSGIETFNPAKKPMESCGFFEPSDDADG